MKPPRGWVKAQNKKFSVGKLLFLKKSLWGDNNIMKRGMPAICLDYEELQSGFTFAGLTQIAYVLTPFGAEWHEVGNFEDC